MLPPIRHRLIIGVAILIGSLSWAQATDLLCARDGSTGTVLLDAGVGPWTALLAVLVTAVPTLGLGLIASAAGNPLAGVFVVSASLCLLAGYGGRIDGWMQRSDLPGGYMWLIVETVIWAVGVGLFLMAIRGWSSKLGRALPWLRDPKYKDGQMRFGLPGASAIGAGLVCAVVGSLWSYLTIRTTDGGQVIGSMMMGYAIGGFAAQSCFQQTNPVAILMSPFAVAIAAYGYVLVTLGGPDQMLTAWFHGSFPPVALALPIHYASAAVAGAAAGIGMAQSFDAARAEAAGAAQPTH